MSTSIRTAAGQQQQQQHTYGPVDTLDMFPLMNCGESADLGDLLDGPCGMNGDKGLSHRFPAWGDASLSDAADLGQPPYSGNISGGSIPMVPSLINFNNNGYQPPPSLQEYQQFIPNGPMPFEMKQQEQQQQQQPSFWNFPPIQQQPGMKVMGPNGMAYPIWWQNVNGTLIPCFAPFPMYNTAPPSSDSDSGQATQFVASSEPRARRRACVERYRKKKARRSFKKHIRYQMRKDNADKRRRVKGRFVRSTDDKDVV